MVDTIKLPCSIGDAVYVRWSRFDGKSEYCRTCTYFRTSSPGKYVKVPLAEE